VNPVHSLHVPRRGDKIGALYDKKNCVELESTDRAWISISFARCSHHCASDTTAVGTRDTAAVGTGVRRLKVGTPEGSAVGKKDTSGDGRAVSASVATTVGRLLEKVLAWMGNVEGVPVADG
jgi:hypothetical protein